MPCAWFKTTFDTPAAALADGGVGADGDASVFLDAAGLGRGHVFVNGHDMGRHWDITRAKSDDPAMRSQVGVGNT